MANFAAAQNVREARTLLFSSVEGQLNEETGIRGYIATRDSAFLQPFVASKTTLPRTLLKLRRALADLGLPEAATAAADAASVNVAWLGFVAEASLNNRRHISLTRQKMGKELVDRFRSDANFIDTQLQDRTKQLGKYLEQSLLALSILTILTSLALAIVGTSFAFITAAAWRKLARTEEQRAEAHLRASSMKAAYDVEKRLADALQQTIVRRRLPVVPSLTLDAVYVPAAEERLVGGDWYDALDIGEQRVLVVIGDVAGHGIEAAIAMSRAREAVFEAAVGQLQPAAILQRTNERLVEEGSPMVTAAVGIAHGRTGEFHYASAGHPPPIVVSSTRPPQHLEFGGVPLGIASDATYRSHRMQLGPGSLLILYTDGAIEESHNIIEGEQLLSDAVAAVTAETNAAARIYQIVFSGVRPIDDVAILAVRFIGHSAYPGLPPIAVEAP